MLTDDGRLFHARVEATGKARLPSVEHLVDGTTSMAESAEPSDWLEDRFFAAVNWLAGEIASEMTCNVSSGMLNRTILYYSFLGDDQQTEVNVDDGHRDSSIHH